MSESTYNGVQELVEAAARVLSSGIVPQGKGTVSEVPNERTIRYYIAQELIPKAERKGRKKVFTDLHLFTLLAIKRFQSEGLPISIIKTLIENRTEAELKRLLGEELVVFTDETSLRNYIQDNDGAEKEDVVVVNDVAARAEFLEQKTKNDAQHYLETLLGSRRKPQPPQSATAFSRPRQLSSPAARPPQVNDWKRFKIVPGLELHVESGYRSAGDEHEKHSIIDSITRILRSIERR